MHLVKSQRVSRRCKIRGLVTQGVTSNAKFMSLALAITGLLVGAFILTKSSRFSFQTSLFNATIHQLPFPVFSTANTNSSTNIKFSFLGRHLVHPMAGGQGFRETHLIKTERCKHIERTCEIKDAITRNPFLQVGKTRSEWTCEIKNAITRNPFSQVGKLDPTQNITFKSESKRLVISISTHLC